jgi:MATE family multidrug resistance protein
MLGLDTLVARAYGGRRLMDCHHSLVSAVYFSLPLAPVLMLLVWCWVPFLARFGIHPSVLREAVPYLMAILWSTFPLLLYFALRRYLQAMNRVTPIMFALVTANLVNVAGNWILVYGHFGAPAMGAEGSGWATCISRIYMVLVLVVYLFYDAARRRTGLFDVPLAIDCKRIGELVHLGLPAATQISLEVGVFAAATALIGTLDPLSLAAHQIALTTASFTYMVPLGISSAAAVRVGQALGRGDVHAAGRAGWTAMGLGAAFMTAAGVVLVIAPQYVAGVFTNDRAVIRTAVSLLAIAAAFQLFDGLQTVATGALRGTGDTRTPMLCHLLLYWLLGLPLGYVLCFVLGWGAVGLWIGLCVALILIGSVLLAVWTRKVHAMAADFAAAG